MIGRPTGYLGFYSLKPKLTKIEFVDKDVNNANWIVIANPVFQTFRKQRVLPAIRRLNEALHPILP